MCMYACKHEYVYTKTVTHAYAYTRIHLSLPSPPLLIKREQVKELKGSQLEEMVAYIYTYIFIYIYLYIFIHI